MLQQGISGASDWGMWDVGITKKLNSDGWKNGLVQAANYKKQNSTAAKGSQLRRAAMSKDRNTFKFHVYESRTTSKIGKGKSGSACKKAGKPKTLLYADSSEKKLLMQPTDLKNLLNSLSYITWEQHLRRRDANKNCKAQPKYESHYEEVGRPIVFYFAGRKSEKISYETPSPINDIKRKIIFDALKCNWVNQSC